VSHLIVNQLLNHIFEGKTHFLTAEFEQWVRSSRRYKTFAETYRDKIRKKHRLASTDDGLRDLQFELEIAYWLLQDSWFEVEYEALAASKQRAPDFTVSFRVNIRFNVEVTRIRAGTASQPDSIPQKITNAICEKAGQMPPATINLLVLGIEGGVGSDDLAAAANGLRLLAERKDDAYFTRRAYESAADFGKQFRRLSGIVVNKPQPAIWVNPQSKHPVPNDLINALRRLNDDRNSG
jgi:hypothetical protein